MDNTYKGAAGTWGEMANDKLMKVRGKDFTKGKNKMKKGAYKGGSITMSSGSYKFTD
ncbi:SRP40, C-terminal domain-domain-containing protein [Yarrowia lipolytica]|nr:SRP40, C-terminal domain-domain-containing protein [Yarrowia lipolytica]RDW33592.1 SRP40, C-terminal domain-domain-containing protein [Yarrowia lipolytica]RDW41074.1 SRP40, C-terminal domain-domain-containing protein [Yarrowia lipolytica]RDW48738.1 SRP40, C-terminal domain-domain-containing protein [Yarrowia lipolytica]RDW55475.1 SRP40, C-terminal domain-domain-containing protein [Yarrowia lipolytica]